MSTQLTLLVGHGILLAFLPRAPQPRGLANGRGRGRAGIASPPPPGAENRSYATAACCRRAITTNVATYRGLSVSVGHKRESSESG